jgi:hypothetical protein
MGPLATQGLTAACHQTPSYASHPPQSPPTTGGARVAMPNISSFRFWPAPGRDAHARARPAPRSLCSADPGGLAPSLRAGGEDRRDKAAEARPWSLSGPSSRTLRPAECLARVAADRRRATSQWGPRPVSPRCGHCWADGARERANAPSLPHRSTAGEAFGVA